MVHVWMGGEVGFLEINKAPEAASLLGTGERESHLYGLAQEIIKISLFEKQIYEQTMSK